MTLTEIVRGKGVKIHLHVDGRYLLTIHEEVWMKNGLKKGQQLTDELLDKLSEESQERFAKERAMRLLSARSYTGRQLFDKLTEEAEPEVAQQVVERMEQLGLVDDLDYARRYARDCTNLRQFGANRTRQELRRRGVDPEVIDQVLEEQEQNPVEAIIRWIERKYCRDLEDPTGKGKNRAVQGLLRRGYSYDEIFAAIREFQERESEV